MAPYVVLEVSNEIASLAENLEGAPPIVVGRVESGRGGPFKPPQRGHNSQEVQKPPAFGTRPKSSGFLLFPLGAQGFHKKGGIGHHPLAGDGAGRLVAVEEVAKLPGGDVLPAHPAAEGCGVIGIGARQRCQHPGSGPARKPSGPHIVEQGWRKSIEKIDAPRNPARIFAEPARHLGLGYLVVIDQLPDEGRLLNDIPSALTAPKQHPGDGLLLRAAPVLGQHRVPLAQLQGRHPPVTIHEHAGRDGHNRENLTRLLDGCSKGNQTLPLEDPCVGVLELELGDFHLPHFRGACLERVCIHHALPHRKRSRNS